MSSFWRGDIDPDRDPHKVMIARDQLIDSTRDNRIVKIKVYYPVLNDSENSRSAPAPLRLPIILWSHGLGGSVDGAAFLSRFIAAHGFVIVHVQHHGTDSSLWEGKDGHPWDIIRATHISRDTTLNRFADVPFVLDQLPAWMADHPEVGDLADLKTLGMSGHSFGALTTQVLAGMKFPDREGVLQDFKDDRLQCGILYSPGSVEHVGEFDPQEAYAGVDIPLFHMTGTDDGSPISEAGYEIRLVAYDHTDKADKNLLVLKDGDHMVFNGSRGKLGQNPNREKHEQIIKIAALCFWDAQLKGNADALTWLTGGGFADWLGAEGEFK